MVRSNPALAKSFPLASLFAGGSPAPELPAAAQTEDAEASFQPKAAAGAAFTENEQGRIRFGQQ